MASYERPVDGDYEVVYFPGADHPTVDDVIRFWEREGVVTGAEAHRRATTEVLLVAVDADDAIAGVSSTYLAPNGQLAMDLWHFRVFIAPEHRESNLAAHLAVRARAILEDRFTSGKDTRGQGVLYEVESTLLQQQVPQGMWPQTRVAFIGEDDQGAHIRVRYFPGAMAPPPPVAAH